MTGSKQVRRGSVLESTGDLMEWWVFPPVPEENVPTFSFEFVRDDGSGRLDHVHVEPEDVAPLIRFLGGVSLSDLQREIAEMRDDDELPDSYQLGWNQALAAVAKRLGIELERKD